MRKVGHYSKARWIETFFWNNIDSFCGYDCLTAYYKYGPAGCDCDRSEHEPLSDEWLPVGAGCFRVVFLHIPTGVAYKIEHDSGEEEYSNKSEHRNYRRLMKRAVENGVIGTHVRIPIVTKYGNVIAMEYIHSKGHAPDSARKELQRLGISDMHAGNWIFDGRYINPIDLASEYYYEAV